MWSSFFFAECGGLITEDTWGESGVLEPPKSKRTGNYSDNADCLWTFRADEGKVVRVSGIRQMPSITLCVQLTVESMDLEFDISCDKDVLIVAAEPDLHSVLHRYCNNDQMDIAKMPDRFRSMTSSGRFLAAAFKSNEAVSGRGFQLRFEFLPEDADEGECGEERRCRPLNLFAGFRRRQSLLLLGQGRGQGFWSRCCQPCMRSHSRLCCLDWNSRFSSSLSAINLGLRLHAKGEWHLVSM